MSSFYLGQITMFGFGFAPKGWALCNGQTMAINQNAALFALLGTMYGGNGVSTFMLPNLMSRVPMHFGTAPSGSSYTEGEVGGVENVTLTGGMMPMHIHTLNAVSASGNQHFPHAALYASGSTGNEAFYANSSNLV